MKWRVAVVGTGATGTAVALRLAQRDHIELIVVDERGDELAEDLRAAVALESGAARVVAARGLDGASGAQIVVLAGDTDDAGRVAARCPDAIVIVAGDRVVERSALVLRATSFPRQRVIGLAGEPSAARIRALLATELRVGAAAVNVLVLGGPGERMVVSAAAGVPAARLAELVARAREEEAADPSAPALTAAAASAVVDAITSDSRRALVCAAECSGEYGIENAVAAVPVVLGTEGIERILEVELDDAQSEALRAAAIEVR